MRVKHFTTYNICGTKEQLHNLKNGEIVIFNVLTNEVKRPQANPRRILGGLEEILKEALGKTEKIGVLGVIPNRNLPV